MRVWKSKRGAVPSAVLLLDRKAGMGGEGGAERPNPTPSLSSPQPPFSTPSRMRFGPAYRILNAGRSRESAGAFYGLVPPRPVTVVLIPVGLAPLYPGPPCDMRRPDDPYGDGYKDFVANGGAGPYYVRIWKGAANGWSDSRSWSKTEVNRQKSGPRVNYSCGRSDESVAITHRPVLDRDHYPNRRR